MAGKINKVLLLTWKRENVPDAECARRFGCSRQAIEKAVQSIKSTLENTPDGSKSELSKDNIDSMKQLKDINTAIINELARCNKLILRVEQRQSEQDQLEREVSADPTNTTLVSKMKGLVGATIGDILRIQSNIIAISAEVRKQVDLQIRIAETLYSVQMQAEFQEEILDVLRMVSPEIRAKVIYKLKERRQVRGLLKMT